MSRLGRMMAAAPVAVLLASPALADGGHGGHGGGFQGGGGFHHDGFHHDGFHHDGFHHHNQFRGTFFFGGVGGFYDPWWWGYPYAYAYPYPYPYPYAYPAPAAVPAAPAPNVWYYCPPANGYYPYVPTCPVPWQLVPARPR